MNRVLVMLLALWCGFTFQAPGQATESERQIFARTKASAEKGNAEAQLQLGALYAGGVGVRKDLEKAAKWHRKAAEQGLARAQYQLGLDYSAGDGVKLSLPESVRWYRKAADQGLVQAQYEMGLCCLFGRGIPDDGVGAVEWFHKAARQGSAIAEYQIGICYLEGTGVAKDITEGIKWIQTAAWKGVAPAQNKFGECFVKGQGVPKDLVQAYKWFALAAAQDDEHALDIRVSMAKLEAELTPEQIAQAQKSASEFKPGQRPAPSPLVTDANPSTGSNGSPAAQTESINSTANTGYVNVRADQDGCDIFVDGAFVGNSPAKLQLAEGSHVIEVKKTGYKDYRRELKVLAGSDLTLAPGLEKL